MLDRAAQAFLELDRRLVAERLAGRVHVGPGVADLARARWLEPALDRLAEEAADRLGDGEQSRDFTYVSNVTDATVRAAEAGGASGRIFNVAAGSPASVNTVAEAIGRILGKPVERRFEPPRPGDIRDSWADVSAARETLGYEPSVELEEGLRRTIEHLGV